MKPQVMWAVKNPQGIFIDVGATLKQVMRDHDVYTKERIQELKKMGYSFVKVQVTEIKEGKDGSNVS